MAFEPGQPAGGLLGLLVWCEEQGVEPVRHGGFIGLRGPGLDRLPPSVWVALCRETPLLRRMLKSEPGPFRQRGCQG
jgi:hypothetical protein